MKVRNLLNLFRRPTPPHFDDEELPGIYLTEPPAPDTIPDEVWCTWPDEPEPAVQAAMDAATAARQAAIAAAGDLDGEDPWAALHANRTAT